MPLLSLDSPPGGMGTTRVRMGRASEAPRPSAMGTITSLWAQAELEQPSLRSSNKPSGSCRRLRSCRKPGIRCSQASEWRDWRQLRRW